MLGKMLLGSRRWSVIVAVILVFAAACSSGASRTETGSGVRIWVGPSTPGSMTGRVEGTVAYNRAEDCFQVVTPAANYPVVWPHGSKGTADPLGVALPDGTIVHDGEPISFGGGYLNVADDYGIPASCLPSTGEVAIIQTT